MPEFYNIAFNSALGVGANTRSLSYNFDWASVLPPGAYEVKWTMQTSAYTFGNPTLYSPIYVQVDLGQSTYPLNQYNKIIGAANVPNLNTAITSYYYAADMMNPPIYLSCLPPQNQITINLLQYTAAGFAPFNINNATVASYIIYFNFKRL
jgi:hypothetical protein